MLTAGPGWAAATRTQPAHDSNGGWIAVVDWRTLRIVDGLVTESRGNYILSRVAVNRMSRLNSMVR